MFEGVLKCPQDIRTEIMRHKNTKEKELKKFEIKIKIIIYSPRKAERRILKFNEYSNRKILQA